MGTSLYPAASATSASSARRSRQATPAPRQSVTGPLEFPTASPERILRSNAQANFVAIPFDTPARHGVNNLLAIPAPGV